MTIPPAEAAMTAAMVARFESNRLELSACASCARQSPVQESAARGGVPVGHYNIRVAGGAL
jgi:hypothetical protein